VIRRAESSSGRPLVVDDAMPGLTLPRLWTLALAISAGVLLTLRPGSDAAGPTAENNLLPRYVDSRIAVTTPGRSAPPMESLLMSIAVLACPVGMGVMMWMMMRGHGKGGSGQHGQPQQEVARLRAEIDELKAERAGRHGEGGR
jgi:hypothetical protein